MSPCEPSCVDTDAAERIRPRPWRSMCGTAARAQTMAPRRFTSSVSWKSSSVSSSSEASRSDARVVDQHVEPAPLVDDAVERALDGEGVGHVVGEGERVAPRERDLLGGLVDAGGVAVDERHVGARLARASGRWRRRCRGRRR